MKQRKPRRFNGQNGQSRKQDNRGNRIHSDKHNFVETDVHFNGIDEVEVYLADQMRVLIRARQQQEEALREMRSLGEQMTRSTGAMKLQDMYNKALTAWQISRRDGVNARQRLLVAMTDRVIPEQRI